MSLQLAAQHLSHQGRGPDDTLVHMSKNELKSLSDLAMAHGGQLTINPQTGLPEAGMLDKLLPTIIGAGITYFSGGAIPAWQVGLGVGAFETVRSGSLQKGLMAGLGAYGGAGLTSGLMGAGEASIGAEANAALAQNAAHTSLTPTGVGTDPGAAFGNQGFGNAALQNPAVAGASNFDKLSGGVSQLFKDPSKVMDSMGGGFNTIKNIGSAAAPLLGAEEVKSNMPQTTTKPGKIRSFSYDPYSQNYTSTGDYEVPIKAAGGGLMGMYDDGYNSNQLNFAQRSEPIVRMADGGTPPPPQTVEDLYTSILSRPSDAGGKAFWQERFGDTLDADEINTFTQSANVEIANRPAAAAPTPTGGVPDTSPTQYKTAADVYQSILGRAPENQQVQDAWNSWFGESIDANDIAGFKSAAATELANRPASAVSSLGSTENLQNRIGDIYRTAFGRDPEAQGLQHWTKYAQTSGVGLEDLYKTMLNAGTSNNEMLSANALTGTGFTPYTGYRSAEQTNIVDEWVRNTLGREPTAADKEQTWYKNAATGMGTIPETTNLYSQFQDYAKADAATTTAQKIKDATASLAARGITEADVLRQTGKTIAELAAADIDLTKSVASASQLMAPGTKAGFDFSGIRKPTTPETNAPKGTTNPYGNDTNPGDKTYNPDGSITVTPNIPGRPYGGFSGMEEVRNAYTDGGGNLGYAPKTPKTMEEFNQLYNKQTGGSKQAYDYLMGKADYSATPYTKTGELMKPYTESVMGAPPNTAAKKVLFDPTTKKYKTNPDYVPITYNTLGEKVYGLSNNEIIKRSAAGEVFAKESGVTYEQISQALNISIDEAKKRYPALAKPAETAEVAPASIFNYKGGYGNSSGNSPGGGPGSGPGIGANGVNGSAGTASVGTSAAMGGLMDAYAGGGMSHLGDYSDGGRLLRGPGDGVSDSIPATIGNKQPARLADGEFVVPARIVSELGNGSTEAGARKLYAMMDRIQKARGNTVGKGKVAKNSRSEKYLPA